MTTYSLLIRLGALTLVFFALLGVYGFLFAHISSQSAVAASLGSQIAQQTKTTSRVAEAKAQLDQLSTQQAAIHQYFVSTNDVVPFLESLQTTGKYFNANVEVASVSAVPGSPFGHLDLSLKITGSFNAVLRTVGTIEYQPYDTHISMLTLDTPATNSASSSPSWTATLGVEVGTQDASTTPST